MGAQGSAAAGIGRTGGTGEIWDLGREVTFQAQNRVQTGRDSPPRFGSGPREGQPRAPSQKPPRRPGPDGPTGLPPHVSSERCLNLRETRKFP